MVNTLGDIYSFHLAACPCRAERSCGIRASFCKLVPCQDRHKEQFHVSV